MSTNRGGVEATPKATPFPPHVRDALGPYEAQLRECVKRKAELEHIIQSIVHAYAGTPEVLIDLERWEFTKQGPPQP